MNPEIPGGAVTTADLYRALVDMHKDVSKALERLAMVDQRNQSADGIHADHETRLRLLESRCPEDIAARLTAIERWRWKLVGATTAAALGAGTIGTWIGGLLATTRGR